MNKKAAKRIKDREYGHTLNGKYASYKMKAKSRGIKWELNKKINLMMMALAMFVESAS